MHMQRKKKKHNVQVKDIIGVSNCGASFKTVPTMKHWPSETTKEANLNGSAYEL